MVKDIRNEPEISKLYPYHQQLIDFWQYAKGYRPQVMLMLLVTVVIGALWLIPPFVLGRVIDNLTQGQHQQIWFYIGLLAFAYIAIQTLHAFNAYFIKVVSAKIRNNARIMCFRHLVNLDFAFHELNPTGKMVERVELGAKAVRMFTKVMLHQTIVKGFRMLGSIVVLSFIDWRFGIFTIIIFLIAMWIGKESIDRIVHYDNQKQEVHEKTYGKIYDFLRHFQIVKMLNIHDKLFSMMNIAYDKIIEHEKRQRKSERVWVLAQKLFLQLSIVAALGFMAYSVIGKNMTVGVGVALFTYFQTANKDVLFFWFEMLELLSARTAMYRMRLLLKEQTTMPEPERPKRIPKWKRLLFDTVFFQYPSKNVAALKNVSFTVERGEKVAIVGETGSGKSTVAKLLLRMYDPQMGMIAFEEKKRRVGVNEIESEELYRIVKIVPQENELMNVSIWENLQYGTNRKVTRTEAEAALKLAAAQGFVRKTEHGLDTVVGPEGMRVSGGEKQRLCLARALLARPELLVLDEATSHLDVKTEEQVHKNLASINKETTVLAVTHRISSIGLFDRVIVMDGGKVVGIGTHRQLLRSNPVYKRLWRHAKH